MRPARGDARSVHLLRSERVIFLQHPPVALPHPRRIDLPTKMTHCVIELGERAQHLRIAAFSWTGWEVVGTGWNGWQGEEDRQQQQVGTHMPLTAAPVRPFTALRPD
jgi:hypothetical protein